MVGETLSAGIGQGYFLTTTAQLSLALAQLINNGNEELIVVEVQYGKECIEEDIERK